jgi:hypothetical protein
MHRSAATVLALGILVVPASGRSEEQTSPPPRQQLGEHLFIARELVANPFTASSLSSDTSIASGSARGPTFDLDGNPVFIDDYSIGFFTQSLRGQWGVADWWALRLNPISWSSRVRWTWT